MSIPASPPVHVASIYIQATPEAIWRALTETEFTLQYYYHSTVESDWRPGSRYTMRTDGELAVEGVIVSADKPRRLVTTFSACWDPAARAEGASRVTWEIQDSDAPGVCRLVVTHDELEGKPVTLAQVSGGWSFIISGLKSVLETGHGFGG
jgi:uncharacterized protein YndB with AHSA1/START domain